MTNLFLHWLIKIRSPEFVILVSIFVVLTVLVSAGFTSDLDSFVNISIKNIQGNKNVDIFMVALTSLGDLSTLLVVGIILTIIRRTRRLGLIFLISMVFIAISIIYIKPIVGRAEPINKNQTSLNLPKGFVLENDSVVPFASGFSYPSNHIAIATAFAFIFGFGIYQRNKRASILIWVFPTLMAATKLYLMQHYLADIVGGFLFGLIISIIMSNMLGLDKQFPVSRIKRKEDKSVQE
ncbi:phosphatase PAP2 family protein [Nitrososphaera sp. AFS]|nr:phosphatase PAP2 family protein [Nitrososphaera sp. AFS]